MIIDVMIELMKTETFFAPEGLLCTLEEGGLPCRRDVPKGYEYPEVYCCEENTCISYCASVVCGEGQACVPETGSCRDLCLVVECADVPMTHAVSSTFM